jgi:CHAT domain-containing protein
MPATPGQADLPGVAHEADTLRRLFAGMVEVLGLPGTGHADYETVMASLPGHPLVHFSCHGESDLSDPSASHLLLADYRTRPLTVLDLTGARLQEAELAFLSACSTARTGNNLPDEPIHLAAACQLAGYRHVIASLWPIDDTDTAALTRYFYNTLTNAPRDANAAGTARHLATRKLRAIYRDRPSLWAPYTPNRPLTPPNIPHARPRQPTIRSAALFIRDTPMDSGCSGSCAAGNRSRAATWCGGGAR